MIAGVTIANASCSVNPYSSSDKYTARIRLAMCRIAADGSTGTGVLVSVFSLVLAMP